MKERITEKKKYIKSCDHRLLFSFVILRFTLIQYSLIQFVFQTPTSHLYGRHSHTHTHTSV